MPVMQPEEPFHPAVARWFAKSFAAPTPAQAKAWPAIKSRRHELIAAPTGSGKTLASSLAASRVAVRAGGGGWVREELCRAGAGAGGGLAGDQVGPACADRGADRIGQDAGGVSGGNRRAGAAGARRGAAGCGADRLCVAAE